MLEAIPTNHFSSTFRLEQRSEFLGELDDAFFRQKARLELEDGTYQLYREGMFSGDFVLEKNGEIVARASKPSAFRNIFQVELPGRRVVLRQLSVWSRRIGLFDGNKQIGSMCPVSLFTRRTNIDVPDDWPVASRAFLFWLAYLIWKRQSQAAAS